MKNRARPATAPDGANAPPKSNSRSRRAWTPARGCARPGTAKAAFGAGRREIFTSFCTCGRTKSFNAKATINREDWGLNWNMALETGGWLVGKEIKLEIDLALDEVMTPAAESADTRPAAAEAQPATA